jgi:hypothetical protein
MALVVDVPLTTTLADLDEVLEALLLRELARHGLGEVKVAFDAPAREWSGKLTGPTVNLFLYDLREAVQGAEIASRERRSNGEARITPPPLRLEATYAITAWTKAIEDEHRLLSQVLSILHSYQPFPADLLEGRAASLGAFEATIGRPMEAKADFWSAVGGQYKPAIDYAVQVSLESGASVIRGPQVRTQVVRTRMREAPRTTLTEMTRFGSHVVEKDGTPVPGAWVAVPALGMWASTGADGGFVLDRVRSGEHEVLVRAPDGREAKARMAMPGSTADIVLKAR